MYEEKKLDKANENEVENPYNARIISPEHRLRDDFRGSTHNTWDMESPDVCRCLSDVMKYWTKFTPIFIDAGTGAGKTTFSIDYVCTMANSRKKNVLYVTNREGLSNQIKNRLVEGYDEKFSLNMEIDDLRGVRQIGNVYIVTYQGIWSVLNRIDELDIGYVIMDEVHYFLSDSLFGDNTWELLEKMVYKLKDVVRIYMTATKWGILDMIRQLESNLSENRKIELHVASCYFPEVINPSLKKVRYFARSGEFTVYSFPRKASNINLKVLPHTVRENKIQILAEMVKATPHHEKWAIFVVSKEKGHRLRDAILEEIEEKDDVAYVDAGQKDSYVWRKLVMQSKFDAKVLITTSVAECGMNIHDPDVKHIVLFTTDHAQFIQELGRKRLEEGEDINVYVPNLSLQQLSRLQNFNQQLVNLDKDYWESKHNVKARRNLRQELWRKGDAQQRHLIDVDWSTGDLRINRCAEELINRRHAFYEDLRADFENGVKSPFIIKVTEWLNVPPPELGDELSEKEKRERAKEFLQSYLGKKLAGQARENFAKEAGELFTEFFGPREGTNVSRDKKKGIKFPSMKSWINDLNLGFELIGGTKDATWYVVENE